ncbi:lysM domain-containing protein [Sarocladium implicatum]|nr:lysM domain-containing protein [Sarocladium implicatum]
MSRFSRYDTDEERLPEGMTRVGYDADTQVYTFQDADGSYWESAPGNQYGQLTRVGDGAPPRDGSDPHEPFLSYDSTRSQPSWRRDMMPLLQFGVIIGVFLLVLFSFFRWSGGSGSGAVVHCADGAHKYTIKPDDTCWAIAQEQGIDIKDILSSNEGVDCENLVIGSALCLPEAPAPV